MIPWYHDTMIPTTMIPATMIPWYRLPWYRLPWYRQSSRLSFGPTGGFSFRTWYGASVSGALQRIISIQIRWGKKEWHDSEKSKKDGSIEMIALWDNPIFQVFNRRWKPPHISTQKIWCCMLLFVLCPNKKHFILVTYTPHYPPRLIFKTWGEGVGIGRGYHGRGVPGDQKIHDQKIKYKAFYKCFLPSAGPKGVQEYPQDSMRRRGGGWFRHIPPPKYGWKIRMPHTDPWASDGALPRTRWHSIGSGIRGLLYQNWSGKKTNCTNQSKTEIENYKYNKIIKK